MSDHFVHLFLIILIAKYNASLLTINNHTLMIDKKANNIVKDRIWDAVVKTCEDDGSGTDANVFLKIYYEDNHDSEVFALDNPNRNDFERGKRDHFKLKFKQDDLINMGLFWWPGYTINEHWCVNWVILLNNDLEMCFEGIFNKWILHYSDPPTYATEFHRLDYASCINPATDDVTRIGYHRSAEPINK